MNFAIIGCGLIGQKRARTLGTHRLTAVADTQLERARQLMAQFGPSAFVSDDWRQVVQRQDVDAVIIATTNDSLAPIGIAAADAGKHVLIEKPAGRNALELAPLTSVAKARRVSVKIGFNLRFHPAMLKAREIFDAGGVGPLMFIRGRYGHGGRIGYDKEWRSDPRISGGGQMLDQGVHLVDLARWFAGDFTQVAGHIATYFWKMPVEDNAFVLLTTAGGQVAHLQTSCSEWKNLFSLEIMGRTGKLQIDGLSGSYGVERLTYYKMLPQMGPPETSSWEYPGDDLSFKREFEHWMQCIEHGREPCGGLPDALAVLEIVDKLYAENRK